MSKLKIDIELGYGLRQGEANHSDELSDTLQKDNVKKILTGSIRCNSVFSHGIKKKKYINELEKMVDEDCSISKEFAEVCKELQQYILDNTTTLEWVKNCKSETPLILEDDWNEKTTMGFNSDYDPEYSEDDEFPIEIKYRTNMFNHIDATCTIDELKIFEYLERMIALGYEDRIILRGHFGCWSYYYKKKTMYEYSIEEFIKLRKDNLSL